jgi:hypothetical protein
MPTQYLKRLLEECEQEHKRLGLPAEDWSHWYAAYMAPKILAWQVATYGSFRQLVAMKGALEE